VRAPVHRASSAAPHGGPRLTIVGRARHRLGLVASPYAVDR